MSVECNWNLASRIKKSDNPKWNVFPKSSQAFAEKPVLQGGISSFPFFWRRDWRRRKTKSAYNLILYESMQSRCLLAALIERETIEYVSCRDSDCGCTLFSGVIGRDCHDQHIVLHICRDPFAVNMMDIIIFKLYVYPIFL